MRNFQNLVDIAKGLQTGSQDKLLRCFHVAYLIKGGRILSIGKNNSKGNAISATYISKKGNNSSGWSAGTHAEMNCLAKVKYLHADLSQFSLVVLRIDNNGNLAGSRPCENCIWNIGRSSLRNIYFSTDDGKFEKMRIVPHKISRPLAFVEPSPIILDKSRKLRMIPV